MINNRQNGRRRGRGGGPRTPNNAPSPGNRQDNRSRGNASQLHEKYKALARDTQLAGDRVQTEYYLQFADHYFRVLNETRARFEEQRPRRDDYQQDEEEEQEEAMAGSDEGEQDDREERSRDGPSREERHREERPMREARYQREPRRHEGAGQRPINDRDDDRNDGGDAGRDNGNRSVRPRNNRDDEDAGEERISLDSLPPAISIADVSESGEAPRAPRRRTRRPRGDGDAEIAPAA